MHIKHAEKQEALINFFYNKNTKVSFKSSGEELGSLAFLRYDQTNNSVKTGIKWD